MNIIVCIKQVPDTSDVRIDTKTNTLLRSGVPSIVNPFDENAVEAALQLRETYGGNVTVITMGPPQAREALKACLAMGADKAYLVSDRAFSGADTLATSYTLSCAIKKLNKYDIILCGKQAIDGDTAQVGPEMAEHLNIPQVTNVSRIEVEDKKVVAHREHDEGHEIIEVKIPVLLTVVKSINEPRLPSMTNIIRSNRADITIISARELDADQNKLGLKGSATQVVKVFTPPLKGNGFLIKSDTVENSITEFLGKLTADKII